jgi:hypothetical protein
VGLASGAIALMIRPALIEVAAILTLAKPSMALRVEILSYELRSLVVLSTTALIEESGLLFHERDKQGHLTLAVLAGVGHARLATFAVNVYPGAFAFARLTSPISPVGSTEALVKAEILHSPIKFDTRAHKREEREKRRGGVVVVQHRERIAHSSYICNG